MINFFSSAGFTDSLKSLIFKVTVYYRERYRVKLAKGKIHRAKFRKCTTSPWSQDNLTFLASMCSKYAQYANQESLPMQILSVSKR